ncbi:hypothetical protein [Pseudomonas fluorescens]|uniref:Uncharacterized protein n=1 Tax=Pseudomonas fluorescens TaxID=294 RepID=A0A4Y9TGJ7_PSEFL|nr:hypothetical protein [Pseudomonas fluorescens]TFW43138.1 hypothetical protein E4T65_12295 [Pseudomonas fluorescens]
MSKINVLVLDDEYDRACSWKLELSKFVDANITVLKKNLVSDFITELHRSRLASRTGTFSPAIGYEDYHLLIVDYDLLGLDEHSSAAWSTGAEIAYTARLMSALGPIVVVNQYGTCNFDLTMKRTVSSYADYDVGSVQITDQGLWKSSGFSGFRPWHWPNLLTEVTRVEEFRNFIQENLDKPAMSTLGFELEDTEAPNYLAYDIAGVLGVKSGGARTFRDIALKSVGLSVFNILDKDKSIVECMPEKQLARVACSIISHWLEKVVLPNQQAVADLPHIVSRFPWLLKDPSDKRAWEKLSTLDYVDILNPDLRKHAVSNSFMYSRPAFWIERIKGAFPVPDDFNIANVPDLVFCEDSSQFLERDKASSYPSDLIGYDNERWVEGELQCAGNGVSYEPQAYLLM